MAFVIVIVIVFVLLFPIIFVIVFFGQMVLMALIKYMKGQKSFRLLFEPLLVKVSWVSESVTTVLTDKTRSNTVDFLDNLVFWHPWWLPVSDKFT